MCLRFFGKLKAFLQAQFQGSFRSTTPPDARLYIIHVLNSTTAVCSSTRPHRSFPGRAINVALTRHRRVQDLTASTIFNRVFWLAFKNLLPDSCAVVIGHLQDDIA